MKGKIFVEVVNNQIISRGRVVGPVGSGHWELEFVPPAPDLPSMSRVIPTENTISLMLFASIKDANLFAEKLARSTPPAEEPVEPESE